MGRNSSPTDTSKVIGVFWMNTSSAVSEYQSRIQRSRLATARCETVTPLGRPVEPDVKIVYAAVSPRTGERRSASVIGVASGVGPLQSTVRTAAIPSYRSRDAAASSRTRTSRAPEVATM
ncbi:hypothetical protein RVF83_00795 [Gordonia rubripertincta]